MKKIDLVGIEDATYSKQDGKVAVGVRLHFNEEFLPPNVGFRSFNEYVPNAVPSQFELGPVLTILYHAGFNGRAVCDGVLPLSVLKSNDSAPADQKGGK